MSVARSPRLLLTLLALTLFFAASEGSASPADAPTFAYRGRVLSVGVISDATEPAELSWRSISPTGALGAERKQKAELSVGPCTFELPVGPEDSHLVRDQSGKLELDELRLE